MITQKILDAYSDGGFPLFPVKGKVPSIAKWPDTPHDPLPDISQFPHNLGIVLPQGFLVLDVDPRNFNGNDPIKKLKDDLKVDILALDTLIVNTGGGGKHVYLKKDPNIDIRKTIKGYPGLDFLSKGNFVVGLGSIHDITKKEYTLYKGTPSQLASTPEQIINLIRKNKVAKTVDRNAGKYTNTVQNKDRYKSYLIGADTAIEGAGGDMATFKVACQGRDLGLCPDTTLGLIEKFWNGNCTPPWSPEALQDKITNAYKYSNGSIGSSDPTQQFDVTPAPSEKSLAFDMGEHGPRKTLYNCALFFRGAESKLTGCLAFNEFTENITIIKQPPWKCKWPKTWGDDDAIMAKHYLSSQKRYEAGVGIVHEAALVVSKDYCYHPVMHYLSGLNWDGIPRLDDWLHTYAGVISNAYTRDAGMKTLVAAVARIYQPGVKFDCMLILEGAQGVYKSTLWNIMGGEWFTELHSFDPQNKDIINDMSGYWIIESGEIRCVRKADVDALKGFLSRKTDRARLAYARTSKDFPRQSIFVGTTNPNADNTYLRDTTGNRRFWPVAVGNIDIEALKRDRDQIWAEAVVRYLKGTTLYLDGTEAKAIATKEQKERLMSDPWGETIEQFIHQSGKERTWPGEVFVEALSGDINRFNRTDAGRISNILVNDLHWERKTYWCTESKKTVKGFVKHGFLED